jgi:TonB family protein
LNSLIAILPCGYSYFQISKGALEVKLRKILLPTLCFLFQVNYSIADPAQDTIASIDVLMKAAEQGNALAQYNAGESYRSGAGVKQDYVQAYKWFSLAASAEGGKREEAAKLRDQVAGKMTPEQMLQARQLVMEWRSAHPQILATGRGTAAGAGTGIGGGIGTGRGFGIGTGVGSGTGPGKGGGIVDRSNAPYIVGPDVTAPVALVMPLPAYTEEARKSRIEGEVVLQCIVRKDGSIDSFKILKGLGYGLDESAIQAIASKWRFKQGALKGNPVDVLFNISVPFRLY